MLRMVERQRRNIPLVAVASLLCPVLTIACGGHSPVEPGTVPGALSATFALRASPIDPVLVDFILPLGNLNPPSHTFPTDHIYFYVGYLRPEIREVPVFAAADGTVTAIVRHQFDAKILVRTTSTFSYYIDHVVLDAAIGQGVSLTAGQRLGTSGPGGFGIDLGVINDTRTLSGFITPARYPYDTIHADAPVKYFEEPMRSQLYALVRRDGDDRDGRIDFDVPGRLVGNWFLEELSVAESSQPSAWPKLLAFTFDNVRPGERRISVGGTLALDGTFSVDAGSFNFADVTPASGLVPYRLTRGPSDGGAGSAVGTMLVQMSDAAHVRVEIIPGPAAVSLQFSQAVRAYTR
jgi:hypothetical protein